MSAVSDLQTAQPLTLKCGLTLQNRLVKAAMAEALCGGQSLPNERIFALYKHWSEGGWGLIITGTYPFSPARSPPVAVAVVALTHHQVMFKSTRHT